MGLIDLSVTWSMPLKKRQDASEQEHEGEQDTGIRHKKEHRTRIRSGNDLRNGRIRGLRRKADTYGRQGSHAEIKIEKRGVE